MRTSEIGPKPRALPPRIAGGSLGCCPWSHGPPPMNSPVRIQVGDEPQPEEELFPELLSAMCIHKIPQRLRDKCKRVKRGTR